MKVIEINIMDLEGWVVKARKMVEKGRIARAIKTLLFLARHPYWSQGAGEELRVIAWFLKQRTAYDKQEALDRLEEFLVGA